MNTRDQSSRSTPALPADNHRWLPARVKGRPSATSRVLVVDDDPAVRTLVARRLKQMGLPGRDLVVFEAAGAEEALEILSTQRAGNAIRAALVDRMLPDLDGVQLVAKMRELDPRLEVAIVTGEPKELDVEVERWLERPDVLVLEKPFSDLELRQLTATLLSSWDLADQHRRTIVRLGRIIESRDTEIATMRSVCEARDAEVAEVSERMLAMSRLESIGQLAAGVAHEINTPSQYVSDNIEFLQTAVDALNPVLDVLEPLTTGADVDDAGLPGALRTALASVPLDFLRQELPAALAHAREGIERVSRIASAMKEFSHPGEGERVAVDVNHAVESAVTISRNEWKYVADVDLDLATDLAPVLGFPDDLQQTVLNLLVNAAHAIADTGEHGSIRIATEALPDGGVTVTIADTGGGIPEGIRDRIFEPFFTTKPTGRGTGQGLAICRAAIEDKHGGQLSFDVEDGVGTTFTLRLPGAPGRTD